MGRSEPCVLYAHTFVHPHLNEYVDEPRRRTSYSRGGFLALQDYRHHPRRHLLHQGRDRHQELDHESGFGPRAVLDAETSQRAVDDEARGDEMLRVFLIHLPAPRLHAARSKPSGCGSLILLLIGLISFSVVYIFMSSSLRQFDYIKIFL